MVRSEVRAQPAKSGPTGRPTERPGRVPEPAPLPTLGALQREQGRPIHVVQPLAGLIYRGQLVGYARGRDGPRYAVVNTGRELSAFRTEDAGLAAGRGVRATAHEAEERRRQRLQLWRLGDDEHEHERDHER